MAKPNYQFEKRQRDLAKKNKQEEKRRQKLAAKAAAGGRSLDDVEEATSDSEGTPEAGSAGASRPDA